MSRADEQRELDAWVLEHERRGRVDWYFRHIETMEPTRFGKTLLRVGKVKTETGDGRPAPGKVRLTLEPDEGSDEFETIETDWLRSPWAWRVGKIAAANVDERVIVTKVNVDPDAKAPQGYRQCVWVSGPNWPSDFGWDEWPGAQPWQPPERHEPTPEQMEPF